MNIPDEAVEAALNARLMFKNQRGMDNAANLMRHILEAAAPHMLAAATEDREEVEDRVKSIVQDVAMTVDYTERLYTAVQEIMAVTMPKPAP